MSPTLPSHPESVTNNDAETIVALKTSLLKGIMLLLLMALIQVQLCVTLHDS
jgi:hypothetical protein